MFKQGIEPREGNMAQASTRSPSERKQSNASGNQSARSGGKARRASANASANGSKASVVAGVATGAAGLVAGAVLGARLGKKPKRVFGVRVPGSGRGLDDVVKEVGKAGKQFKKASRQVGQLTSEVQAARKKAEEIGRIIT